MGYLTKHKSKIPDRHLRLADQIQRDLAEFIQRDISISRAGLITITEVEVSSDHSHARIFFTTLGAEPAIAQAILDSKAGYFHSLLFKRLQIYTVPSLKFIHDQQTIDGLALTRLIDQANNKNEVDQ